MRRDPRGAHRDRGAQPFSDLLRAAAADAGQHDKELLAAEAVDELEGAKLLAHLVGDVAEHGVAAIVAVACR